MARAGMSVTDWFEAVQPFAYGVLGLHPWELRRYTVREVMLRAEGHRSADRAAWRKFATLACWLLQVHVDKDKAYMLTPDSLLGVGPREWGK